MFSLFAGVLTILLVPPLPQPSRVACPPPPRLGRAFALAKRSRSHKPSRTSGACPHTAAAFSSHVTTTLTAAAARPIVSSRFVAGTTVCAGGGGGFGASKVPTAAPHRAAAGANPFDGDNFAVSEVVLPIEAGQSTLFMGTYLIEDASVCDDLVAAFKADAGSVRPPQRWLAKSPQCTASLRRVLHNASHLATL